MMIKKIFFALTLGLLSTFGMNAQKIASIDMNAIMESQQDYQDAQEQLDKLAARWNTEIEVEKDKIKGLYNRFQAEQVLLSDEIRDQKIKEIESQEKRVREMQREKFGANGALFQQRQQLVQPIQERVYTAIEDYADDRGYDFIFDQGGSAGIIFANPQYDKTKDIIEKLK